MKRPGRADIPGGFRFAAVDCGLRKTRGLDLALIAAEAPCSAAAVFTTNRVQAAPVQLSRAHVRKAAARMRAIVVNAGNANCSTGPAGMDAARATAAAVARELRCRPQQVLVCSTGVIGVPLRVEKILSAVPQLGQMRSPSPRAFQKLTRAMMTTDTRPKWAAASLTLGGERVRILGCAKGAGMIHPRMATMLAFLVTDAAVPPAPLQRALRDAVARSFNRITVDGDTSTNDTVILLARGASDAPAVGFSTMLKNTGGAEGHDFSRAVSRSISISAQGLQPLRPAPAGLFQHPVRIRRAGLQARRSAAPWMGALAPESRDYQRFACALEKVCLDLALQIVADGEGAKRVVEIEVRSAPSERAADQVARTIANSPLVKTALAGADPNWGRILAAAGRAGVPFDPNRATIWMAGIKLYSSGRALPFDERAAHRRLLGKRISIVVDLGEKTRRSRPPSPRAETRHSSLVTRHCDFARIWTCDFTAAYVDINASYRS